MDRGPAAGLTRRQWLRRAPRVQLLSKAKNVENAGSVGQNQLRMYHTENTNGIQTPQILRSPQGRET